MRPEEMRINRRRFIKGGTGATLVASSLSLFGGVAGAWDRIETNLDCPSCEKLIKFEQQEGENPEFTVAEDFGVISEASDYSIDGNVYTLQPDDADVDARIELIPTEYSEDGTEIREINFVSDALVCKVEVEDGNNVDKHVYYTDRELPVIKGEGLHVDDDGDLRGISNLRFYYCPQVDVTVVNDAIDITRDQARFGIWWGAFHLNDDKVYQDGTKPDRRSMSGQQCIFEFDSPYIEEFINDPLEVNNPSRMKAELLVEPDANNGQGFVGEIEIPPGGREDFAEESK